MLHGSEPIDVFFSPIAEPDLCTFDASHHAGGEVHSTTKHIAFLYMHWPDMNAGTNLYLRVARIPLKRHRVVQRSVCRLERSHETVADGFDLPTFELGDQFAALGKVFTADLIHGLISDLFSRRADNIGEHNRQSDPLTVGPFLEAPRARLAFGRHNEGIEVPVLVGGPVH